MVPAAYVQLESLPSTPGGKLDRKALPPPHDGAYARRGYEAPVGEIETVIAGFWADVLKLSRVGRNDNFFEAGGDSIRAIRLSNVLQQWLEEVVYVTLVFEAPTVAEAAEFVRQNYPDAAARFEGNRGRVSEEHFLYGC